MHQLEAQVLPGVQHLDRDEWTRLDCGGSPFLDWEYLEAIERASAVPTEGFAPAHLTLREEGRLIAVCPMYVKGDGRAEFIYDWNWYGLAAQLGVEYYPKLIAMCPITPAVAPRFLIEPGRPRAPIVRALVETAEGWAREAGMSGLHWLFVTDEDADALEELGYFRRESAQLRLDVSRWSSFDNYLASFRARHRKRIKRERRHVAESGLRIELVEGDAIDEELRDALFGFYSKTCWEHGTGSDYLKRESWDALFENWRHRLLLCVAREPDGAAVAGSLSVQGEDALYGRYWGCRHDQRGLYFELTCYAPLEFAMERGLSSFWAGFGNAPHKHARGFEPTLTLSMHRVFDERLDAVLREWSAREREFLHADLDEARTRSRLIR